MIRFPGDSMQQHIGRDVVTEPEHQGRRLARSCRRGAGLVGRRKRSCSSGVELAGTGLAVDLERDRDLERRRGLHDAVRIHRDFAAAVQLEHTDGRRARSRRQQIRELDDLGHSRDTGTSRPSDHRVFAIRVAHWRPGGTSHRQERVGARCSACGRGDGGRRNGEGDRLWQVRASDRFVTEIRRVAGIRAARSGGPSPKSYVRSAPDSVKAALGVEATRLCGAAQGPQMNRGVPGVVQAAQRLGHQRRRDTAAPSIGVAVKSCRSRPDPVGSMTARNRRALAAGPSSSATRIGPVPSAIRWCQRPRLLSTARAAKSGWNMGA